MTEKGFCMRGDLCPYDHGLDPVVVDDVSLGGVLAFPRGKLPIQSFFTRQVTWCFKILPCLHYCLQKYKIAPLKGEHVRGIHLNDKAKDLQTFDRIIATLNVLWLIEVGTKYRHPEKSLLMKQVICLTIQQMTLNKLTEVTDSQDVFSMPDQFDRSCGRNPSIHVLENCKKTFKWCHNYQQLHRISPKFPMSDGT